MTKQVQSQASNSVFSSETQPMTPWPITWLSCRLTLFWHNSGWEWSPRVGPSQSSWAWGQGVWADLRGGWPRPLGLWVPSGHWPRYLMPLVLVTTDNPGQTHGALLCLLLYPYFLPSLPQITSEHQCLNTLFLSLWSFFSFLSPFPALYTTTRHKFPYKFFSLGIYVYDLCSESQAAAAVLLLDEPVGKMLTTMSKDSMSKHNTYACIYLQKV